MVFVCQNIFAQIPTKDLNKECLDSVLNIYELRFSVESPQYADAVQWCAYACMKAGDNRQAQRLLKESDKLFKRYGKGPFNGRDTINEILNLDTHSGLEVNSERDFYAIKYAQKSLKLKRKHFRDDSKQVLNALLDLSQLYAGRLNYKKAAEIHNEGFLSYVELLKNEFCSSSESKRNAYWKVASNYVGKTLTEAHKYAGKSNVAQSSMASAAYNAILLSKGILLNTTIDFSNYVKKSNEPEALRLLDERIYAEDFAKKDSLDYKILDVLQNAGKKYNIPQLSITWKDVANQLGKDDVAIEFFRTGLREYGALIIKKGCKSPIIVKLNDNVKVGSKFVAIETALRKASDNFRNEEEEDPQFMWEISKSIWNDKIVKYLPETENANIYFSADGMLQLIGLESLPFNNPMSGDNVRMSDIYNLYRLSSTRTLAIEKQGDLTNGSATLYGDINYDLDSITMRNESNKYPPIAGKTRALRPALNSEYIQPLAQTSKEVDSIAKTIQQASLLHVKKQVKESGNEESFKNLSGSNQKILHIATHGFYKSESDTDWDVYDESSAKDYTEFDMSMQRTGLLLAGAQKAFYNEEIPDGVEDGILTAYEISQVDLSNLDIAVLSACETALGDITSDGVAGLQRGFKQAGANSLLMSLWKVDDEATCRLMTEFYSNWIDRKMSKHDALESAKITVRETPGWEDPKYWAAFILLDALN